MEANEYQKKALRTANTGNNDELMLNGVFGLAGEVGEVVDLLKKHIFQGHDINRDKVLEECSDVCWYVAITAHSIGLEMDKLVVNGDYGNDYRSAVLKLISNVGKTSLYVDLHQTGMIDAKALIEDALWNVMCYIKVIVTELGSSLEEVFEMNIDKLLKRYPHGFKTEDSIRRIDED